MPKVKLYNSEGGVIGEKSLKDDVFGVAVKPALVHEVVVGLQAGARQPLAHTKTRGEVRGGGRKPWKQKGTGRARHGSTRSPIWVGGGITFGPRKERDYSKKINRKAKKQALLMSLSDKVANDRLVLVESLAPKQGKTKETVALLGKLPAKGKLVLVTSSRDEMLARSTRNLGAVRLLGVSAVGLMDVLNADYLVMTPAAADKIESIYSKKS
jgi:large subunit ribosomal protein L4